MSIACRSKLLSDVLSALFGYFFCHRESGQYHHCSSQAANGQRKTAHASPQGSQILA